MPSYTVWNLLLSTKTSVFFYPLKPLCCSGNSLLWVYNSKGDFLPRMNSNQSLNPHRKWRGMLVVDIHILYQDLLVVKEPACEEKLINSKNYLSSKTVHHQMYWLKKRPWTCNPFCDSVTSFVVMSFFEVFIESVVVDCCASNFIRSAWRNCIISIDNVTTIRRFNR